MKWIIKNIPNLFTLTNLVLGVLAIEHILSAPEGSEPKVHYFVFAAAFCDLLDGALARALKVPSKFGVQLDSLADLVTFGVLPTFIYASYFPIEGWGYLILLVPVCSAIRLAIFNISDNQSAVFKGISTTAHGLFVSALPIVIYNQSSYFGQTLHEESYWFIVLAVFFSFLMVSPMKMISLKFKGFTFRHNWEKYTLLLSTIPLVAVFRFDSAPYLMMLYLLLSLTVNFKSSENTTHKV
jgi:CDP-diacylglycerol--serine O-phosphatidyltransferase